MFRSILQAPFTPFIVIFCNAVLHCDPSDMTALSEFVFSLESCRTVSEGADKLYKMCHLFLQVAKLYVDAKTKESTSSSSHIVPPSRTESNSYMPSSSDTTDQTFNTNAIDQFDPYLSALGLMPVSAWPMSAYPQTGADGAPQGQDSFANAQGFDPTGNLGAEGVGVGPGMQNGNNVQDWFSGSRYLMNLMEDDIQMPDFSL
jgi:hypothetical protein